jgi:hypothetical protein
MGSLREELIEAARAAVREDLLQRLPFQGRTRQFAVVLGGSAVTDDCDEYSGCDLIVFRVSGVRESRAPRPRGGPHWQVVRRGPHRYRYTLLSWREFVDAVGRGDDAALYLLRHGEVIHDPQQRLRALWQAPPEVPVDVWTAKLAARYRAFRLRRASLAWCLRRGQPVAVLDNLRLLLEHALSCCYYLQGEPAPPRKWIFRGALRTPAGRALREPVLDLLSSLGELAVLGGSLHLRQNRLYLGVSRVQDALERVLLDAGFPVPGLAALAGNREPLAEEDVPWHTPDGDEPRVRRPRRGRHTASGSAVGSG